MMSGSRILAVIAKDVFWVMNNFKLLVLLFAPLFFAILFSMFKEMGIFFTLIFINAFIGLYFTSYSIIEEKKKGTLLALLTSPLKDYEFLIGKCIFTITTCLLFSVFTLVINKRMDLISQPLILLNIIFFSGMTCSYGYILGVFFKNEQELSIFAPLFFSLFMFSDISMIFFLADGISSFFPDYHLLKAVENSDDLLFSNLLIHTGFNFVYCLFSLAFSTFYTRFYFSNANSEIRISKSTMLFFVGTLSLFITSGLLSPHLIKKVHSKSDIIGGMNVYQFTSDFWSGKFLYDKDSDRVEPLLKNKKLNTYKIIKFKEKKEFLFSLFTPKDSKSSNELRIKKMREHKKLLTLGVDTALINDVLFRKWIYLKDKELIFHAEASCGKQLLKVSIDTNKISFNEVKDHIKTVEDFLKNLELKCNQSF